jgi:NADH-quinone oxidoreductase subunit J
MGEISGLLDTQALAFFGLATLTLASGGIVAFSKNVIHSTLGLLGTFTGVAGMYVTLAADFLAGVQLLVYVGGTLTLILFAVMLTSRIEEKKETNPTRGLFLAAPLVLLVLAILGKIATSTPWTESTRPQTPATALLGHAFLGRYLLPFELASVVLLGALIGAVVLARRAVRRKGEFEEASDTEETA